MFKGHMSEPEVLAMLSHSQEFEQVKVRNLMTEVSCGLSVAFRYEMSVKLVVTNYDTHFFLNSMYSEPPVSNPVYL